MKFGTARKDVVEYTNKDWLHSFKKGETKVRFLQECDDWILFREHYTIEGKSFPCTNSRETCPGCMSEIEKVNKSSRKYAANVLNLATGRVQAYKMPITLANRLTARAERNNGSIITRDYNIIRTGDGLETEYDVEQDEKYDIDINQYKSSFVDIEAILSESFQEVWGSVSEVTDKPAAKKVQEVPPFKPTVVSQAPLEDEEIEVDEETVRSMKRADLVLLYSKAGVEVDEDLSTKELAENLIKQFSA